MSRIKSVDMLNGNLLHSIISFSIPLLFVSLIQNLFNAVDIMVLGYLADTNAVAAVGATGTIIHLLVNVAFGISGGAKIILSRLMGEGNDARIRQTVYTSILTGAGLGIVVAAVGLIFSPLILRLTACPADIFDDAVIYMSLYFAAGPAIMLYNFGSNILQVSGDSQRPLFYMVASGLLNVGLNVLLCLVMTNKVAAVAIATAASQALGALLVMIRLFRMEGQCRLTLRRSLWSTHSFCKLMSNGIPIGITSSLYSLATLQIQSAINSYGPAAIAGNSACASLEAIQSSISAAPWSTAAGVFVAKNVGADNRERVKRSFLYCTCISGLLSLMISILQACFSTPLLSLYVGSSSVAVSYGKIRMLYTVYPYAIAAINGILASVIQSFGYSVFTTVNSIVSVLIFRILWMAFVYPQDPTFHTLMRCFLVSWCLIFTVNVAFFCYVYFFKFSKGKIKKIG